MKAPHSQFGFTLVEMIVSLAVFSIVLTVSVGALLVLVATNQQLQAEQSVMTNLSFALDSMTREIRTGSGYYCESHPNTNGPGAIFSSGSDLDDLLGDSVNDCPNGYQGNKRYHGISIIEGGDSISDTADRILYFYDTEEKKIFRKIGNGNVESIVSSGIVIEECEFVVTGTKPLSDTGGNRTDQPVVTVFIKATEKGAATNKPYYLQTTITQRTLDV